MVCNCLHFEQNGSYPQVSRPQNGMLDPLLKGCVLSPFMVLRNTSQGGPPSARQRGFFASGIFIGRVAANTRLARAGNEQAVIVRFLTARPPRVVRRRTRRFTCHTRSLP